MLQTELIDFNKFYEDIAGLQASLSAAEQERAQRFVREQDRRAYVISHAELRRVLSETLNQPASELEILIGEHGKPYINNCNLQFNLSHSGCYALIALSDVGAVGVDIEQHDTRSDYVAIAKRFFTKDEFLYIENQSDQRLAFYVIWTYKEAYVKAIGRGIAYGLDSFSVVSPQLKILDCVNGWSINSIKVPNGYSAAISLGVK